MDLLQAKRKKHLPRKSLACWRHYLQTASAATTVRGWGGPSALQSYFTSMLILIVYWTILSRRLINSLWKIVPVRWFNLKETHPLKKSYERKVQRPQSSVMLNIFQFLQFFFNSTPKASIHLLVVEKASQNTLQCLATTVGSFSYLGIQTSDELDFLKKMLQVHFLYKYVPQDE